MFGLILYTDYAVRISKLSNFHLTCSTTKSILLETAPLPVKSEAIKIIVLQKIWNILHLKGKMKRLISKLKLF